MIIYFDHLVSMIVGGVVLLMLVSFQSSVQETTLGRTMLYASKKQTLELADMIERDLENAGFQTPPGQVGILSNTPATVAGVDITQLMEFWTEVGGVRTRVRYDVAYVDTVTIDDITLPLFQMTRSENAGAGWSAAGGSAAVLTGFRIDLRTDKNQPTTDLSAARALHVRLGTAIAPGVQHSGHLRGMRVIRWGVLMRPPRLQSHAGE